MNSQTFMYGLGCGSGTTTITLKFGEQTTSPEQIRYCQVLEKKLKTAPLSVQIEYEENWMCQDNVQKNYTGFYYKDNGNHGFICVVKDNQKCVWYECFIVSGHRTPQTMEMSEICASTGCVWTTDKISSKSIILVCSSNTSCGMYIGPNQHLEDMPNLCLRYTQQKIKPPRKKKSKKK